MSASRRKSYAKGVSRDNIRGGRGRERRSRSGSFAALFKRLRRLELAVVAVCGKTRNFDLDSFCEDVLQMKRDAEETSGKREHTEVHVSAQSELSARKGVYNRDRGRRSEGYEEPEGSDE